MTASTEPLSGRDLAAFVAAAEAGSVHGAAEALHLTQSAVTKRLAALELSGPAWQAPAHHVGNGAALLEASKAQGLEGLVAKRRDCPYVPGRRSAGWVKVKNVRNTDVVVGGKGRDRVTGGLGHDRLHGNAGHDTLIGGAGFDTADGARGRDRCVAEREKRCER